VTLSWRSRAGRTATLATNAVSRRLKVGSGTVVGGRVGLAVDPKLLSRLADGRPLALVSGTNGKTTTTRLLAEALGGPVVTNATGSNMPAGHVAALAAGPPDVPVVLEVDEGYLPALFEAAVPTAVVLLNLSRDQLDRTNEVRMLAARWRRTLLGASATTVVANADDPLVVWGASSAPRVVWVAAGLGWHLDAVGCPSCEGRIEFTDDGWSCTCGFSRPEPAVNLATDGATTTATFADGGAVPVELGVPGRFNRANAVMAAVAAEAMGVDAERALGAMAAVDEVAGRFSVRRLAGHETRLMLAKNPAGWAELLGLVCPGEAPVVVSINARVADGRDPSWLWDVPFEALRGRPVVATGERCRDLAVRLRYAEVPHTTEPDPLAAVAAAGRQGADDGRVEFIGNYTAFFDLYARR
jgi:UDP-N-acetylmuramyl tripeptide synthase